MQMEECILVTGNQVLRTRCSTKTRLTIMISGLAINAMGLVECNTRMAMYTKATGRKINITEREN